MIEELLKEENAKKWGKKRKFSRRKSKQDDVRQSETAFGYFKSKTNKFEGFKKNLDYDSSFSSYKIKTAKGGANFGTD